ncbi:MAG: hypothetical protein HWN67_20310 [Candidatus Helarchaeota archaeon]|nr:hypothetical protein [Candidatus Helarchaeota archaeon]
MKLNRIQTYVLAYGWFHSVYFAIWAFIVYSTSSPYNAYGYGLAGTFIGGIVKALTFVLVNGLIILASAILIILDNRQRQNEIDFSWQRSNYYRIIILGVTFFFALPWLFAIHGIFISDVPGLNMIFLGGQPGILGTNPFDYIYPAVHLGLHHGTDGYLHISYATAFSILIFKMKKPLIRNISIFGMGFLAFYGFFAYIEDFFHEQILKRGFIHPIWHLLKLFYDFGIFFGLLFGVIILIAGLYYFRDKE